MAKCRWFYENTVNLDSLAVLLFVEIWLLIIQPLFSQDEWYNVERKLKSSTKNAI